MKKKPFRWLSVMLALVLVFTGVFCQWAVAEDAPYYGDINQDGQVSAADALMALQHTVQLIQLDEERQKRGDVNEDGKINATDALMILQYVVSLIDRFPADRGNESGEKEGLVFGEYYEDVITENGWKMAANPWSPSTQVYAQAQVAVDPGEIRTTFQQSGSYAATNDVPSDSTMVYLSLIENAATVYESWKNNKINCGQKSLDIMTAIGRDNGKEYFSMYPERKDYDACKRSNGTILYHGGGTSTPYMCPTRYYREYKIKLIDTLCKLGPGFIAIEEPESFLNSCYNEGFKEEWLDYYGTEFVDPASSAEARYMASRLMSHLWKTMVHEVGSYMKEHYPNVDLVIATHSTVNYTHWGIHSAINSYTSSEYVDGIIGQTWSDTVKSAVRYAGANQTRLFESAFTEYASYVDSMQAGQTLYTLTDAKADDDSLSWDEYRNMWEQTLVAELMQQGIRNFQECVWPSRGFTVAPADYRPVQMAAFNALREVGEYSSTLYAGTPGISVALSDNLSWHSGFLLGSRNSNGYHAITLPLIDRGIPVKVTALDLIKSTADLDGVELLILSYDSNKPIEESINQVIADWVKAGGTLLYLGGHNDYDTVSTEWWTKKGQTPYENLLQHLDLSQKIRVKKMENYVSFMEWLGPQNMGESFQNNVPVGTNIAQYSVYYEGSGFHPILQNAEGVFGFDAAVGQGHLISVGLPSAYYAETGNGDNRLRDLVEYATTFTDVEYHETNLLTVQRGNYIISHATDHSDGETLQGRFIDLFDKDLPVITSQTLAAGENSFLYDISGIQGNKIPCLAYTSGDIKGEVVQDESTTAFTLGGPNATQSSSRLLGNGRYPQSVIVTANGVRYPQTISLWDNATQSLLIQLDHEVDKLFEITVTWGDTPVEDTVPYTWKSESLVTGSRNMDAQYLLRTTATSITSNRRSTYDTETVYQFDLDEFEAPFFEVNVFGNYLVQVSSDDKTYTTLYDYSTVSDVYVTDIKNRVNLPVIPSDFGITSGKLYVRIANNDPTKEYGGGIMKLHLYRKTP